MSSLINNSVNDIYTCLLDGSYEILLVFNDGNADSQPDTVMVTATASSATNIIEVAPGLTHEDLITVDWPNLVAENEVKIHWRQEPYRTKIGLRSRGTVTTPIRISGVPGAGGERPEITGEDAVTPASLNGFFDTCQWSTETIGVITIIRGPDDDWGYKSGYIEIEGLKIYSGHPDSQFTGMDGYLQNFEQGAAGINANVVEHLSVRDCEFTSNGNGFFLL